MSTQEKPKRAQEIPGPNGWFSVKQAADYLNISPYTLLYLAKTGRIKGYRVPGMKRRDWRFRKEDL